MDATSSSDAAWRVRDWLKVLGADPEAEAEYGIECPALADPRDEGCAAGGCSRRRRRSMPPRVRHGR